MTESQYRDLVFKLDEFAKKVGDAVPQDFGNDRLFIMMKIREINGFLRDIRHMTDFKENPEKVIVEMRKRATNAADEQLITPT